MTATRHQTTITADPELPTIEIVREFDAPPELVFRAFAEPELVRQWLGPRSVDTDIETWDCRTGGEYRYRAIREGAPVAHFYGSFHQVRPHERIVQTFGFEEMPDAVSLDIMAFEDLGGGRTRTRVVSLVESRQARDDVLRSGMERGVIEGYEKLDELLARVR